MNIVMLVLGVAVAQVAVALLIARLIRAGKGPRILQAAASPTATSQTVAETRSARPAIDNYSDLSALLIALDPHPERAARDERAEADSASPSTERLPNQLGPWPGAPKR